MKRRWIAAIVAAFVCFTVLVDASADNEKPASGKFAIGDDIDAARRVLDAFDKPNGIFGYAFVKGPEDEENIHATLDPKHMSLCAWYSKSKRTIHRMAAVCKESRRAGKADQVWLPITAVELNRDGTHTLTFAKPLTLAELEAEEKERDANPPIPQYPPSNRGK